MALPTVFTGFSSINTPLSRSVVLTNIDLIKRDLLNHFYTLPGENRMRPAFGCRLRQMIFDPFVKAEREAIIGEVTRVVTYDQRVDYINSTITDIPYGIVIAVQLRFNQFSLVDTLIAKFEQRSDADYGFTGT